MKYTNDQKATTNIFINFGRENFSFKSQVLPFNKTVCAGLDKEFADAINEFFKEYPLKKLPSGTIYSATSVIQKPFCISDGGQQGHGAHVLIVIGKILLRSSEYI